MWYRLSIRQVKSTRLQLMVTLQLELLLLLVLYLNLVQSLLVCSSQAGCSSFSVGVAQVRYECIFALFTVRKLLVQRW